MWRWGTPQIHGSSEIPHAPTVHPLTGTLHLSALGAYKNLSVPVDFLTLLQVMPIQMDLYGEPLGYRHDPLESAVPRGCCVCASE